MADFLHTLFSGAGFMPRQHCGLWTPTLMTAAVAASAVIALSYYLIPALMLLALHRRRQARGQSVPFRGIALLYVCFILLCGTTHLLNCVLFYNPVYRLDTLLLCLTAGSSAGTVVALYRALPAIVASRSPEEAEEDARQLARALTALTDAETNLVQKERELTAFREAARRRLKPNRAEASGPGTDSP